MGLGLHTLIHIQYAHLSKHTLTQKHKDNVNPVYIHTYSKEPNVSFIYNVFIYYYKM